MCGAVWCLLLLLFCPGTDEMVLEDKALASQSRCHTYELERGQNGINSFKRHSDGTFTNDYTHSLDKIKAKEFVHWLASTKRERKWIQFNGYQSTKRYTDKEAYKDPGFNPDSLRLPAQRSNH